MLKTTLWIAAACAAVLIALAVSRGLHLGDTGPKTPEAPVAPMKAVTPPAPAEAAAALPVPPPPPPPPKEELTPDEQQIQDDAAATGMTTVEPTEAPKDPPTN